MVGKNDGKQSWRAHGREKRWEGGNNSEKKRLKGGRKEGKMGGKDQREEIGEEAKEGWKKRKMETRKRQAGKIDGENFIKAKEVI